MSEYNSLDLSPRNMTGNFYEKAIEAYDTVVKAEHQAKDMIVALHIMGGGNGMGGALMGPPGTVKSRLLYYAEQTIEGYESNNIANIPHRADVKPAQLTGEVSEMETTKEVNGETVRTLIEAKLHPILNSDVLVVKSDEMNRLSPAADNAQLSILQDGGVVIFENRKERVLSRFDLVLFAMNNYGTRHTYAMDPAKASRLAMASFTGIRKKGELSAAGTELNNSDLRSQEMPSTGFNRKHLLIMREAIPSVMLSDEKRRLIARLIISSLDDLQDRGMELGDGRLIDQIHRIARVFALMTRKEAVQEVDVLNAFSYSLTAKFGALGCNPYETAQGIEEIFAKAA
jgi:MoxR-like ATPase